MRSQQELKVFCQGGYQQIPRSRGLYGHSPRGTQRPDQGTPTRLSTRSSRCKFVHYSGRACHLALVSRILQRGSGRPLKYQAKGIPGHLQSCPSHRAQGSVSLTYRVLAKVSNWQLWIPVPTTRATASRALGSLWRSSAEDALPRTSSQGSCRPLQDAGHGAGRQISGSRPGAFPEVPRWFGNLQTRGDVRPTILQRRRVAPSRPMFAKASCRSSSSCPMCFGNSFGVNYLGQDHSRRSCLVCADDAEAIRETSSPVLGQDCSCQNLAVPGLWIRSPPEA